MAILADHQIINYVLKHNMISPFVAELVREEQGRHVISYGLSSHGYDMRCTGNFWLCKTGGPFSSALDPKGVDLEEDFLRLSARDDYDDGSRYVSIPARGFVLTNSVEYWRIPRNIQVVTFGKSTYARVGLIVNVTPMEAGWEGSLTIEISNTAPFPVRVYVGEGIAQAIFHEAAPCDVSYADRNGKYQNTQGVVAARV